jgi:DNA/RNA-binding domain of Phe-tRNA-synthetase-like protein
MTQTACRLVSYVADATRCSRHRTSQLQWTEQHTQHSCLCAHQHDSVGLDLVSNLTATKACSRHKSCLCAHQHDSVGLDLVSNAADITHRNRHRTSQLQRTSQHTQHSCLCAHQHDSVGLDLVSNAQDGHEELWEYVLVPQASRVVPVHAQEVW